MKKKIILKAMILTLLLSCSKKEAIEPENPSEIKPTTRSEAFLSIESAQTWFQTDTSKTKTLQPDWKNATQTKNENAWLIPISGSPIFQRIKQGYRKLLISRDSSNHISSKILEIIPDAYALQEGKAITKANFSGRILVYDNQNKLESGKLYYNGKTVGEIIQKSVDTKKLVAAKQSYHHPQAISNIDKQAYALYESCQWYDSGYVDAEGVFTIHSERVCSYTMIDDGNFTDGGGGTPENSVTPTGGGGGGSPPPSPVPEAANLPDEEKEKVDPRKLMDCFSLITNPNAAYVVKVHVQEPLPGTSFNIGPNSFGHVAIELSVTSGSESVTQIFGYYPTGSGFDKMVSDSRIVDNSDLAWDVSATFFLSRENFQKIVGFASAPPTGYDYATYNCTSFVYTAATLGGISLPSGYNTVGPIGPGGATVAQTPAGMGSELRAMKANNPNLNISAGGGRAGISKGECK